MKNHILFNKENLFIVFLFFFSLLINQYYGNKGIFPVDSFAHFDTGFRILLGEYPFKNYWVISGPFVDYLQAIFFYVFGANWQSYVLHASLINAFLSLTIFVVLRNFNLNIYYSFIYSLFFSVLAYPTSGTPFVDHHSAFFSLLGICSLILGIKTEKKLYWLLLPIFLGFAFLSKQVPSFYVIISVILSLCIFSLANKEYYWIKHSFLSSIIFILLLLGFGKVQGINLSSFLEQYIFYPQTIGLQRIDNFVFTFHNFASSNLETIYTPSQLAQSKKYEVNTLEHTVLMNNNGRFESIKLPREAQIAPSFGTEILDVDDDGILDVILAHNFFSPQRETGRMDGGLSLVLKGNGDCTFSALPHSHTGISVSGDTRKVKAIDLNGNGIKEIAFAQNNGPLIIYSKNR